MASVLCMLRQLVLVCETPEASQKLLLSQLLHHPKLVSALAAPEEDVDLTSYGVYLATRRRGSSFRQTSSPHVCYQSMPVCSTEELRRNGERGSPHCVYFGKDVQPEVAESPQAYSNSLGP